MSAIALELSVLLALIFLNGLFAMSEIAVLVSRKARLQKRARSGHRGAQVALELHEDPSRFLSTIQVGITLIGVLAGAFGQATLAGVLQAKLEALDLDRGYSEIGATVIVVAGITYLSVVLGELVPKQLGLTRAEGIASRVAPLMRGLSWIAAPAVAALAGSSTAVLRLFGVRSHKATPVSEEEIRILVDEGARHGDIQPEEREIVERAFGLGDTTAGSLMTHRPKVLWLDLEDTWETNWEKAVEGGHSRLPVAEGELDQVTGQVEVKDLVRQALAGGAPPDLRALVKPALFVSESTAIFKVLALMRQQKNHVAMVVDEYGGFQGLVTSTDIFEALAGEIPEPGETAELDVVTREDGSWLVSGLLESGDLEELLKAGQLPGAEQGLYRTLSGFTMARLGKVPVEGDRFEWGGFRFEVVDMDGRRVDKVLVTRLPASPTEPPPRAD